MEYFIKIMIYVQRYIYYFAKLIDTISSFYNCWESSNSVREIRRYIRFEKWRAFHLRDSKSMIPSSIFLALKRACLSFDITRRV